MITYRSNKNNKTEVIIIALMLVLCIGGYLLNFQNLWEYWPESDKFVDVPIQWIMSAISVFIPPIGMFTGWIF